MKITLENTEATTTLVVNGAEVPARIWQGTTDEGIPVHCYITRIVPEVPSSDPAQSVKLAAFERDLKRVAKPRAEIGPIPLRMII